MPLPALVIAIPVLHSSGAWIASTAATGYLAGTLSSTWIGAFVLGNSTLLGSLGLVSAAGVFSAMGGLSALATGATAGIGSALASVGLGGAAASLGIAPVATFLGLTPIGWAIAGSIATVAAGVGYLFTRHVMSELNKERVKGGLSSITIQGIFQEVRAFEESSLAAVLMRLAAGRSDIKICGDAKEAEISGQGYSIRKLSYVINEDGSEEIRYKSRTGRATCLLTVKNVPAD